MQFNKSKLLVALLSSLVGIALFACSSGTASPLNSTSSGLISVQDAESVGVFTKEEGFNNGKTLFEALAQDSTGNIYTVGWGQQVDTLPFAVVRKYDANGNLLWAKEGLNPGTDILFPGGVITNGANDSAWGVTTDSSGNAYVVGTTVTYTNGIASTTQNAFVTKLDSTGNVVWSKPFGSTDLSIPSATTAYSVNINNDGLVYISGSTVGGNLDGNHPIAANETDAFIIAYDQLGNKQNLTVQLEASLSTNPAYGEIGSSSVDGNGGIYLSLNANVAVNGVAPYGIQDGYVVKYDTSGQVQWTYHDGAAGTSVVFSKSHNVNGQVYVAGYTNGLSANGQNSAIWETVDLNGNLIKRNSYDFGISAYAVSAYPDKSGNVYVTGAADQTYVPGNAQGGYLVLETDASGNIIKSPKITFATYGRSTVDDHILSIGQDIIVNNTNNTAYTTGFTSGDFAENNLIGNQDGILSNDTQF